MQRLYLTEDKGIQDESEHTGWLLAFSLFSWIHPPSSQCASSERNLEQPECGVHRPLPIADFVFLICALLGKYSTESFENVFCLSLSMPLLWRVWNIQGKESS